MVDRTAHFIVGLMVAVGLAGCLGGGDDTERETSILEERPQDAGRHLDVEIVAMICPPGFDNQQADNICLAWREGLHHPAQPGG